MEREKKRNDILLKIFEVTRSTPDPLLICMSDVEFTTHYPTPTSPIFIPLMEDENTIFTPKNDGLFHFNVVFERYDMNLDTKYFNPLLLLSDNQAKEFMHYWEIFKTCALPQSNVKYSHEAVKNMDARIKRILDISEKFVEYKKLCDELNDLRFANLPLPIPCLFLRPDS